MSSKLKKKKIAILGGGIGGLSAAWHLTHPDNPDSKKHEITVYQQGWLLGGKCASVKNKKKNYRIEEHGVHLFGGGYFNALHMMKECYEELVGQGLRSKKAHMGTFESAFHHQDFSGMWLTSDDWPEDPRDPGGQKSRTTAQVFYPAVQVPNNKTVTDYKSMPDAFDWMVAMLDGGLSGVFLKLKEAAFTALSDARRIAKAKEAAIPQDATAAEKSAAKKSIAADLTKSNMIYQGTLMKINEKAATASQIGATDTVAKKIKALDTYQTQIAEVKDLIDKGTTLAIGNIDWKHPESKNIKFSKVPKNATAATPRVIGIKVLKGRQKTLSLYLELLSVLAAAFVEDLLKPKKGFDALDDEDYISWLKSKHCPLTKKKTSPELIASPLAIAHPNILFAYPDGDTTQIPKMSAGAFFYWMIRTSAYLGHYAYRFKGGTGETVITPLYKVLKKRGVKFEFFHTVKDIRLGSDGNSIDSVDFDVQAQTPHNREYEPLKTHKLSKSKSIEYWPEEPDYSKLVDGSELRSLANESGIGMESFWWQGKPAEKKRIYAGEHFDHVVVAMSLAALPSVCGSFRGRLNNWDKMFATMKTTPTQALQIWTKKALADYGHPVITENDGKLVYEENGKTEKLAFEGAVTCANYNTPFSCHVDFTDLLTEESWGKGSSPNGLVYFCGPMIDFEDEIVPDDPDFVKRTAIRTEATSFRFLQTATYPLMPKATSLRYRGYGDHRGMDFDILHSKKGTKGIDRMRGHYYRANVNPTDRYVLSVPGSGKTRIRNGKTGIDNLSVAGDWTYTGINAGCVEGTVMSGKLASESISKWPKIADIVGFESTPWAKK